MLRLPRVNFSGRAPGWSTKGLSAGIAAVVVQADHRPGVIVEALRPLLVAAIAEGDEQEALPIEDQARAEVASAARLGEHPEQDLHVAERLALQPGPQNLGAVAAFSRRRRRDRSSRCHGSRDASATSSSPPWPTAAIGGSPRTGSGSSRPSASTSRKRPGTFADQHPPVGQKGQAPGVFETFGDESSAGRAALRFRKPDAVTDLGQLCAQRGLQWFHLPIEDEHAPEADFDAAWQTQRPAVHRLLDAGKKIAIHCKGGSGRTGLMAAQILVERGWPKDEATRAVKALRPNALSLAVHQDYLAGLPAPSAGG
jgi:hypothetical protein